MFKNLTSTKFLTHNYPRLPTTALLFQGLRGVGFSVSLHSTFVAAPLALYGAGQAWVYVVKGKTTENWSVQSE